MAKAGRYDVVNSPYLELETPFTLWYGSCITRQQFVKLMLSNLDPLGQGVTDCKASCRYEPYGAICQHVPLSSIYREAVKMALLLPTVPFRLCIAVAAIVAVALVNSIAIFGW